jgi:carboxyl-terminal processing protease
MTQDFPIDRRAIVLSAIFMFLLIILAGAAGVYILSDKGLKQALTFVNFTLELEDNYPGRLDWNQLLASARQAMFEQLDRYSGYVEPVQFDQLNEEMSGSYSGIGVSVVQHDQGLLIISVRENSPAAEVGLLSGDIIIEADGVELAGLTSGKSTQLLRGREGTSVKVAVFRPVLKDTLTVDVTRRKVDLLHIPFAGYTPDSVIYIRVLDFEAGTSHDIEAALDSLLHKKDMTPKGIILDLRGNPGGLFIESYHTANLFLEKGQFIVGTDGRSRWKEEKHYSTGHDITGGLPMAVMVDGGSASSAEIVSGSLQQLHRAVLVGDTTFGKGLVQGFTRFPDGSGLRLTISRYYLAGGVYLNQFDTALNEIGSGLAPDYFYRSNERSLFPRTLENSLLLQQFANLHQDEIIAQSKNFELADSWLDRFKAYARDNHFIFTSPETELAEFMVDLSHFESHSRDTRQTTARILDIARKSDMDKFDEYGDYIKRRLRRIAVERKYGTYRAYADVVVRSRPDIRFAARILKDDR